MAKRKVKVGDLVDMRLFIHGHMRGDNQLGIVTKVCGGGARIYLFRRNYNVLLALSWISKLVLRKKSS